jgi:uncharacterized protein YecE (DUF72 family)
MPALDRPVVRQRSAADGGPAVRQAHRLASRGGTVRVGISGWTYAGWRGGFYPQDLRHSSELSFASREVDTIEINGTHYSLQRPESFARWREETPDGFVFAVKGSRFITHLKQLRGVETALANFFASGVLRLEEKLGPFLWQFSPRFRFDRERLETFLALLPRDTEAAAGLAEYRDQRLAGRAWTRAERRRPLRHAIEIRHQSFDDPDFAALLRRQRVALVFADSVEWPYAEGPYRRFCLFAPARLRRTLCERLLRTKPSTGGWRGSSCGPTDCNPDDAQLIAPEIKPPQHRSRDVFVYFDNDAKVRARRALADDEAGAALTSFPLPQAGEGGSSRGVVGSRHHVAFARRLREPRPPFAPLGGP